MSAAERWRCSSLVRMDADRAICFCVCACVRVCSLLQDVRRGDGWTVLIYVGQAIYVTHQRWEQNLVPESDPRHFEVRWEMRLSFDRNMQQLRAVIMRIQELAFHEESTPAYRQQIRDILAGGGYIV